MAAPDHVDLYAVIGHPISHSLSPRIHALFAAQTGQALRYEARDVPPAQLPATLRGFFASGGAGLNVTIPHKQAVLPLLDILHERARRAGAVNTVLRSGQGLVGDNTDGIGLVRDLVQNLRIRLEAQRLLLLGAGGAARGILAPLLAERPAELVIANRDPARALALAQAFTAEGAVRAVPLEALAGPFDLILNATAASLHGQLPALPAGLVGAGTLCYDLAYGPRDTAFLAWARAGGAHAAHLGLGMLVEQAAEAFWLWRGVRPSTAPVLRALRGGDP